MSHLSRSATILAAPLTIAALLACVTPAGALLTANALTANGTSLQALSATAVAQNGVLASARMTTGSALADFNGVAVEEVTVPDAALR